VVSPLPVVWRISSPKALYYAPKRYSVMEENHELD
jgi:hypothetical protein